MESSRFRLSCAVVRRAAALAMLLPTLVLCQEYRGKVLGRITDPTGSPVPGVTVSLTNLATNVSLNTQTNDTGNYQIPFVEPGNYEMAIDRVGFQKVVRKIEVNTLAAVTVDTTLQLGSNTQSVTVEASTPLLNTVNGDLQQVIGREYVDKIILSKSRDVMNLVGETPGVAGSYVAGRVSDTGNANVTISGGGGRTGGNQLLVDGMPNSTAANNTMVYLPPIDTVQEVQVQTSLFDAAYGLTQGGTISITTLPGGNSLHGTAFLYKRYTSMEANTWTGNSVGSPRPPVDYYQAGFNLTGPVYLPKIYNGRNRTFFNITYETDTEYQIEQPLKRVPTARERQGDFSQTLSTSGTSLLLYDPLTTVVNGSSVKRQLFPNEVIPASRITATGSALLNLYPLPNLNVLPQISTSNWAGDGNDIINEKSFQSRVDHNFNERNRLMIRYGHLAREVDDPIFDYPGSKGNYHNNSSAALWRWFTQGGLSDTITLSPTLVAVVSAGFARYYDHERGGYVGYDPNQLSLSPVIIQHQVVSGWPNFSIGDGLYSLSNVNSDTTRNNFYVVGSVTRIAGKHSLRVGVDLREHKNTSNDMGSGAEGTFSFSAAFTASNPGSASSTTTSGASMASALLGLPMSGSLGYTSPTTLLSPQYSAFVQDDWKLLPNLTLNFGLRWDLEGEWAERHNRAISGFDYNTVLPLQVPGLTLKGGPLFAGVDGHPRAIGPTDHHAFGPRFGFAYQPIAKTVVRGGFGIFYAPILGSQSATGSISSFGTSTPFVGSSDSGITINSTLANPFPNGFLTAPGSSAGLLGGIGNTLTILNPNITLPYTEQWGISLQHEFPLRILAEAGYLGYRSLRQPENFDLNELPDSYLALGSQATTKVTNPFLNVFPSTSTLGQGATINQSQLWKQYPQYPTLTIDAMNTGRTNRHALNVKVDKRFSHHLSVLWTFAWAKMLTANTSSIVNPRHYYSVPSIDQARITHLATVYETPWRVSGQGLSHAIARGVLTGWSLSGSFDIQSGFPLSISGSNGRPYVLRNPSLSGPVEKRLGDRKNAQGLPLNPYFDTSAFKTLPTQYMVSPTPEYLPYLRGTGEFQVNASMFKTFRIHERFKLEVRGDAVGLTNTPRFGSPGTNINTQSTFGVISSLNTTWNASGGARLVTMAARVRF